MPGLSYPAPESAREPLTAGSKPAPSRVPAVLCLAATAAVAVTFGMLVLIVKGHNDAPFDVAFVADASAFVLSVVALTLRARHVTQGWATTLLALATVLFLLLVVIGIGESGG